MIIHTKVKLNTLPKNNKVLEFVSAHFNPNKLYYPKFFPTKYTNYSGVLKEQGTYLLSIALRNEVDSVTKKDLQRAHLYLQNVSLCRVEPSERNLGKAVLHGVMVDDIQIRENVVGTNEFDKDIRKTVRLKLTDGKYFTYVWWFDAPDELGFKKADNISLVVRLINKPHYDDNFCVDRSEENLYKGKVKYNTELGFESLLGING